MFKNTKNLHQSAINYMANGYYTSALPGTQAYYDYWDGEKHRCLYGYTIGDLTITGNLIGNTANTTELDL